MTASPVHAVIVAFHSPQQLTRCLDGLDGELPATVVDNSSSAEVATVARSHGAAYLDPGVNLGFAAAVNLGIATVADATADVLLLNPDAVISPRAVAELAGFLRRPQNARVAAIAPRLVGSGGEQQRSAWPFPSPRRLWAEALGLRQPREAATFLVGAVLLLRREAIADVGPFDERFFLYAEETDWQRRALARGWSSLLCEQVTAEHAGGGTSSDPRRRETLFHAAQETYVRKWFGRAGWWRYRAAACVGGALRTLLLARERRAEAARRTLLYLRGPRRCAASEQE